MSDIGGTPITRDYEFKRGRTYQYEGSVMLPPVASDKFLQLVKKMKDDGVFDAPPSEEVKFVGFDQGRAAYFHAQGQPFLLIDIDEKYRGRKYAGSFIFDPVAKTYLGSAYDVFMGLIETTEVETSYIRQMGKKMSAQSGLIAQYESAAVAGHVASATQRNRQVGFEYLALKKVVTEMGNILTIKDMQVLDGLFLASYTQDPCSGPSTQAAAKVQPAIGFMEWLKRTLG